MNIIFSGFFHPLVGILSGFLLIIGSEYVGKFFLKKFIKTFFFLNLATGVISISLVAYIFITINISKYSNPAISYILILLGICNFYHLAKNFYFKHVIDFNVFLILLILFLLLILSIAAPTMADSLGYHLGVAKYINANNSWPDPDMWLHSNIAGLGEVYISLGLLVYSDTVGSLVQLISLIAFLHFFFQFIDCKQRFVLFVFFILGSPVIVFLLSGAKFQIFPQLISAFVFYSLIVNKKINHKLSCLLLFLIFGIANFKLSFLISGFVLTIFLLTKTKINFKFLISSFFIFSIIFLPKALFHLISTNDPTYLTFFTLAPPEFLSSLRNFRENSVFFPLNLFIPHSVGQVSTILGFQFVILFFMKNIKKENFQIIICVLITSILYFLISQSISRIYYEMILWLSLSLVFIKDFRVNLKYLNIYLILNISIVFTILIVGFYNLSPSLISNEARTEVMRNNSNEFKGASWVNQNIPPNSLVLTNLRSISLIKNSAIPMDFLNYNVNSSNLKKYFNYLKSKKIDYIIIKNFTKKKDYFFKKCEFSLVKQSPSFLKETRNPFNRSSKYSLTILKPLNRNLSFCIK
jgi:hypothetical protein|tara:strand:+ start:186 stop:1928 length:1743 start_codon:yes stop_codon:yes gene_type:complete